MYINTIVGIPKVSTLSKNLTGTLKFTILPLAINKAAPLNTPMVPNEIITGAQFDLAITNPFNAPHSVPQSIPNNIASPSGMLELIRVAIKQATNDTSEPTDKSKPPDKSTIAIAIEQIPVTEICLNRLVMFCNDKKFELTRNTEIHNTTIITKRKEDWLLSMLLRYSGSLISLLCLTLFINLFIFLRPLLNKKVFFLHLYRYQQLHLPSSHFS